MARASTVEKESLGARTSSRRTRGRLRTGGGGLGGVLRPLTMMTGEDGVRCGTSARRARQGGARELHDGSV
jgi:hypothetical protein